MAISCPATNDSVIASAGLTICVSGTVEVVFFAPSPSAGAPPALVTIKVIVYQGHGVLLPVDPPAPPPPLTDAVITGQDWCATDVPVPSAGNMMPGDAITVVAWQLENGNTFSRHQVECYSIAAAVGSGIDCCDDCGGSGSDTVLGDEVSRAAALQVAVPDGPHKGMHDATRVGPRTWGLMRGKDRFTVHFGRRGPMLIGATAASRARQRGVKPFSAAFPGVAIGAKGEVVVTVK